ncbi:tripartite tricarboxylate transporter substrate binding protein [Paeniroseomonas aquatica]|uniref:Tripartite tricarboxylate transporter substrate binding protein n=2 Tax=Paeniroseomonas aquatica TaxID=373043 RepID=A0ABT8ADL0_9PROT|nr:tripartite tricarboxylate transporter substrate binding protein [Paeniroseomonas aquatica]MDN3567917.1 tripartite tricarboxylate transporter substrate binding protein [Paeniroseomonas aquatica]
MQGKLRRRMLPAAGLGLLAGIAAPGPARAQAWPTRPVRLIVPFPPGGGVDLTARLLAEPLGRVLGQSVVVENRGGAGGILGVEAMSHAPPDGHVLSLTGAGTTTAGPHLRPLPYDAMGLGHVTRLVRMPFILAVRNTLPARSLAEFIALGRAGEIRWASGGIGTSQHLAGELFKQMSGIAMVHVPYRGTGPALADLAAGIVDAYFGDPATLALINGGQARAMAVTAPERWPLLPETPAVAEAVPGYAAENWYGLAAPPGTPPPILDRLSATVRQVLAEPATAARFEAAGLHPATLSIAEYRDFLRRDTETWGRVVRAGNIRVDGD